MPSVPQPRLLAFALTGLLLACQPPTEPPGLESLNSLPAPVSGCTDAFADYAASATWFCQEQGCTASTDAHLAVDGLRQSFSLFAEDGQLSHSSPQGELTLSVRPQAGVVFPGGTRPGFWLEKNTMAPSPSNLLLETRLNGRVQDVWADALNDDDDGVTFRNNAQPYYHFVEARRPFDELRLVFRGDVVAAQFRVYEACVEGYTLVVVNP